ncbi:MAG TPA: apolipoprotein N-acyltransferase [Amaricoccus sp.]|nr:apolipoprotein N-acyltransferase [Amaricoccus sp.]
MTAAERRIAALGRPARLALAVASGAATALAQPPVSWPLVLFAALPLLLWLLDAARGPRAAFALGWAAGAGHFAAALFWIVDPFLVEPEVYGWMAPFALVGMAGGLALFWAVPFAVARALWRPGPARILLLASLWTLADYARATILTGFPWGLVGYAWVETPVAQAASFLGPFLLGLLTLVAALLPGLASARALAASAALVAAGWGYGAWRLAQPVPARETPLLVRVVQPNARQELKWQPGMEQLFYERHLTLTAAEPRPDVTIWSETAVPFVLDHAPELLAQSAAAAAPGRLILGIRRVEQRPDGDRWFNSLAVLNPDGTAAAVYDKHHLVPFGEYIPFQGAIARLGLPALTTLTRGGFTPGDGPHLIAVPGIPPFLPLICYEAIFPGGLRAPEGRPEWMVQVTNDAWFGEASGPWQHLAQARMRAIEQGLPLARAANTGISAMIDPYGRVTASLGLGQEGALDAIIPGPLPATFYARHGDFWGLTATLALLGLTVCALNRGIFLKLRR